MYEMVTCLELVSESPLAAWLDDSPSSPPTLAPNPQKDPELHVTLINSGIGYLGKRGIGEQGWATYAAAAMSVWLYEDSAMEACIRFSSTIVETYD